MRYLVIAAAIALVTACSAEPGSKRWCEAKKEQPKSEWSGSDLATYTKNCVIDGTEIGSESWCEDLAGKPKGEWTGDEASSYAKHCVM